MAADKNKLRRVEWLVWSVVTIMFFFYALENYPVSDAINYAAHSTGSYALLFYGNALWLIPYLYRRKKYVLYFTASIVSILTVTYLRVQSQSYIWFTYILKQPVHIELKNYYLTFVLNTLFFVFSIAFRYTLDYFNIRQQQEKLLKQHAEAQLNLLKAQVQPHFLFNTLNNIYFVAQRESPLTADLIEKLSFIMRYFLEQGPQETIPLDIELDFIRNYIELESMRLRHPIRTTIDITADTGHIRIPPMLLIPLIENVFKHGINRRETDNYIWVRLDISERLHFQVTNRLPPESGQNNQGWGIGLDNLSKRLHILYDGNFVLTNDHSKDAYTSHLIIPV